jgi:hypothetical protein
MLNMFQTARRLMAAAIRALPPAASSWRIHRNPCCHTRYVDALADHSLELYEGLYIVSGDAAIFIG